MSVYVTNGKTRAEFLEWLTQLPELALDVESVEDVIVGIGLGTDEVAAYFTKGDVSLIVPWIPRLGTKTPIVMHNGKSDVKTLRYTFKGFPYIPIWDTMVAANVLGYDDLDLQTRALEDVGYLTGKYSDLIKEYKAADLEGVPEGVVAQYNLDQVVATWQLHRYYAGRMVANPWSIPVFELEMQVLPILLQMEENGMLIDKDQLLSLRERYAIEADAWVEALKILTGNRIQNPNSPKQVKEFLYGFLGYKSLGGQYVSKRTGDPSTSERVLKKIAASSVGGNPEYRWIRPLLRARQTIKLIGTYCDGIAERLDSEGRSHTSLSQTTADTGRLASRDPNHQNIPKRRGPEIRRCFVAPRGWVLVAADMDQLELRIIAEESGEELMRNVFLMGGDIHLQTALDVFGDPAKRFPAKILNYTIGYLAGAQQIADQIGISKTRAEHLQQTYFRRYWRLTQWINDWDSVCRTRGYTETWLGRRRDVTAFYADARKNYAGGSIKEGQGRNWGEGTRKSINTRIQGTAAEIVKINMVKVERELRRLGLASRQLIQVHDEIVLEVPEEELDIVKWVLRRNMSTQYKEMPLPCTIKVGKNWGDVH